VINMRDLHPAELGFVYGAGGKSRSCKPRKMKCKGGSSGSRGRGSKSRSRGKHSRSKSRGC
jgi:hypothetical protein